MGYRKLSARPRHHAQVEGDRGFSGGRAAQAQDQKESAEIRESKNA
jgi:hypothetical protein